VFVGVTDMEEEISKLKISKEILESLIVFRYNEKIYDYKEIELEKTVYMHDLMNPDVILLFVDNKRYRVWLWHGSNTTMRMKSKAAILAPKIRDRYGISFQISAVDEGNETLGFRVMLGLEEEKPVHVKKKKKSQPELLNEKMEQALEFFDSILHEKGVLHKVDYGTFLSERVRKKIESLMQEESVNELTIQREYLPEIFSKDVLELSDDGLPTLTGFILEYLKEKGISTEAYGKIIKFFKES